MTVFAMRGDGGSEGCAGVWGQSRSDNRTGREDRNGTGRTQQYAFASFAHTSGHASGVIVAAGAGARPTRESVSVSWSAHSSIPASSDAARATRRFTSASRVPSASAEKGDESELREPRGPRKRLDAAGVVVEVQESQPEVRDLYDPDLMRVMSAEA